MDKKKKVIGIIGGMGPAATAELFKRIIDNTDAKSDAEHIHIIIDNYPQIPDRTQAILNNSNEPVKFVVESGNRLTKAGAEFLLIPCNTSHYYFDEIQAGVNVPVINMIEETAKFCADNGYNKVGVLATNGTIKTGVYGKALQKFGIDAVYPSEEGQKEVMSVIYDYVKAGKTADTTKLAVHLKEMEKQNVKAFILGCTELPLALNDGDYGLKFIDTIDVLAKSGIVNANYKIKD